MASSASVSELIWHFAGYLQAPPADNFIIKIMFEGGGSGLVGESDVGATLDPMHRLPLPDELPNVGLGLPQLVLPMPYFWRVSPIYKHYGLPHSHAHTLHVGSPALPLPPAIVPLGDVGGDGLTITVTYQPGGDQELIDVRQINVMVNNNAVNAPADVVATNEHLASQMMVSMLDKAQNAIPADLDLTTATTNNLKTFVDNHDAHPLVVLASDASYAVQPGVYVNGMAATDGTDPHQLATDLINTAIDAGNQAFAGPPPPPSGDHSHDSIQHISVGSDITTNDAVLANFEGLSVSLAVLGNYYQTSAIIQTNVFNGFNHVAGDGSTAFAPNTIQNVADFKNDVLTLTPSGESVGTISGLNWSADVLHGSLFDIHSLIQTNYLSNNNVVYQTSYMGESQVIAGGNTLLNTALFQNLTANYDLIIVEGNYHQDNLIYQQNVLLDYNNINFNGMGYASQSASGGGNSLVNDASITDMGNHSYQAFTPDAMAVIQALEGHAGTLDGAALLNAFPDLFGSLHVLLVTGDYYDVNYISQTNVVSNVNTVQLNGDAAAPSGATQSVSTGHDITVNSAQIIDGGSIESPYLQGNYYNDMILIQTNIIGNDGKIVGQDPSQLAPEIVAFTSVLEHPDQNQHTTVVPSPDPQHHNDGVATVMH